MKIIKLIKDALDRLLVFASLTALLAMIVIIIYQVFSRQLVFDPIMGRRAFTTPICVDELFGSCLRF